MPWWLTAACLIAAAGVAGWPARNQRARRRMVIGPRPMAGDRPMGGRPRAVRRSIAPWAVASPRRTSLVAAVLAGCAGAAVGGPVAAIGIGAYGGLAARVLLRGQDRRQAIRERHRRLDGLCGLAADLRAGLPVPNAIAAMRGNTSPVASDPPRLEAPRGTGDLTAGGATPPDRIDALILAAGRLAEQTGAPLADLVERIEADARAMDRGLAGAAAQAAGAQATAWLLAALPLGGIALGYGIGVDPLDVLLRTPIGAGCAIGAIALQFAGLAWAERLNGGAAGAV